MTPQQKKMLDEVVNEELTGKKSRFKWDDTFQKKLLAMLLRDRYFLVQALDKVKPEYFSNEPHVLACQILFHHFQKYSAIPEPFQLLQDVKDKVKDRDAAIQLYYAAEVESLYDYYVPGLDTRDALIDKITFFAKVQAAKEAFNRVLPRIMEKPEDEETWEYYYEQTRNVMLIDRNHDPGLEYFLNIEEMFRLMRQKRDTRDRFTSGFESIDNALTGGGLYRGEIGAWIALPGSGKSLCLVKGAVANVRLGHKVVYITLELDELGVTQRFTSQFMRYNINNLLDFEKDIKENIAEFSKDLADPNMLLVKQFPGGGLDVNGVRAYLSQSELRGFKPDLVIVDYVGEMKMDASVKTYEAMYRILRDLRGFGVENKHCTLTCMQPNRTAAQLEINEYIDESNIGSSFDQFRPLDAFWSINQQVEEKEAGVGRGFVIKHRNGRSRFPFKMGFDYSQGTLDVYEISNDSYKLAMNNRQEQVDVIGEEEFKPKDKKKKRFKPPEDEPDYNEGA